MKFTVKLFLLTFILFFLNACTAIGYYTQGVVGHSRLMLAREPIDSVILSASPELKQKLLTAIEIRTFASEELGLPWNKSYSSYVKLKHNPPIWNVIATEEFSMKAKQWCYFVIGCASYRGYYAKDSAEQHANQLRLKEYDVHLAGASAYSTLGWFDDPLTSAMINRSDASLAELIFHELAHQQLYVKGDSRFNEAFASAVGELGAQLWLSQTGRLKDLEQYKTRLMVRDDFLILINDTKILLNDLYASDLLATEMRKKKHRIFEEMKNQFLNIKKEKWNNKNWYATWFDQPVNNARLAAIGTYRDLVPNFVALFERCGRSFTEFYTQVEKVSNSDERNLDVGCQQ